MTLMTCKACRKTFSDDLDCCPNCGEKTLYTVAGEWIWAIIFGLFVGFYLLPMLDADLRNQERIDRIFGN